MPCRPWFDDTPRDLSLNEHRRHGNVGDCTLGGRRMPQPRREQVPEGVELRSIWLSAIGESDMPVLAEADELADSLLGCSPVLGKRGTKQPEPGGIRAEGVNDLTDEDCAVAELKAHGNPT